MPPEAVPGNVGEAVWFRAILRGGHDDDALDALVERVKGDRSVLAAVLCGSLSHDTVWARSDIDLVLVTIDDRKVDRASLALDANVLRAENLSTRVRGEGEAAPDELDMKRATEHLERRLLEFGFVHGEEVEILAEARPGRDPFVVRVGYTTLALRRREAQSVWVQLDHRSGTAP